MFKIKSNIISLISLITIATTSVSTAQVTGGRYAFQYLSTSNSPYVSALGGIAPANMSKNVSLTLQNPALLNPNFDNQLAVSHNFFYGNIGISNLQYAWHHEKSKTDFSAGIQYFNYGTIDQNDYYGNSQGTFYAADYSINVSASRQYRERWRYGATLKGAHSLLGGVSGLAFLADFGITYTDTTHKLVIGAVAKNLGIVAKKYNPNNDAEPLPFDLQLGIAKQLENVPIRLFAVVHHLNRWDIRYDNPADKIKNIFNPDEDTDDKKYFGDKLFRHFNFGTEIIFGQKVTFTAAYSHLRRKENGLDNSQGAAGFSFGLNIDLNKLQVSYGRSYYGSSGAYNELGLIFDMNKMINTKSKKVNTPATE